MIRTQRSGSTRVRSIQVGNTVCSILHVLGLKFAEAWKIGNGFRLIGVIAAQTSRSGVNNVPRH